VNHPIPCGSIAVLEDAANAIACAHAVIRRSLEALHKTTQTPTQAACVAYSAYAEVPSIGPLGRFDPHAALIGTSSESRGDFWASQHPIQGTPSPLPLRSGEPTILGADALFALAGVRWVLKTGQWN
jgi:hypothetical protein